MKKSVEIIGLSVVAISDGKEIGTVIDLVINPSGGFAEFLIVDTGVKYLGTKVISIKSVEGIGEHAVIIENEASVIEMKDAPQLLEFLQKDVTLIGTKVLTKKGKLVGSVTEFYIDEEAEGKISGFEMQPINKEDMPQLIVADDIITFGKDTILIKEELEKEERKVENDDLGSDSLLEEEVIKDEDEDEDDMSFEKRQIKFLLGRKVSKRIQDSTGEVIAEEGALITEELINEIQASDKLAELVMNNRE